jgi:S-DNA-T family DNA segregation ATPase FtsK/SpoIIIE
MMFALNRRLFFGKYAPMASRSPTRSPSTGLSQSGSGRIRPSQPSGRDWDGVFKSSLIRSSDVVGGIALMAFAFVLWLAIATFSAADASFTTAAGQGFDNWLGKPGSYVASLFLLVLGWPALLVPISLGRHAWRKIMGHAPVPGRPRLMVGMLGILLVGMGWAVWDNFPTGALTAGSGGFLAMMAERLVDPLFQMLNDGAAWIGRAVLAALLAAAGLWIWVRSLGMSLTFSLRRGAPVADDHDDGRIAIDDPYDVPTAVADDADGGGGRSWGLGGRRRPVAPVSDSKPEIADPAPPPPPSRRPRTPQQGDMFAESSLPQLTLLTPAAERGALPIDRAALEKNARLLESVLEDFQVKGQVKAVRQGPVVTMYELEPAPGTKASRVSNLADDIARNMSALSARIAPIPGRTVIGIELPNTKTEPVVLHQLIASEAFQTGNGQLPIVLGKNIAGDPFIVDLAPMPHLLIAGTTGSGKSVGLNAMILSLLYRLTPDQCRMILIDPKMLELSVYDGIPHLLSPVVTEPAKAVRALRWAVEQMEDRYRMMANLSVRNLASFNEKVRAAKARGHSLKRQVQTGFDPDTGRPIYEEEPLDFEPMPQIVVVVDELADLMITAGKEVEVLIQRIAQKARAAGIHLILATQRPSVDVITGVIKANLPTRISFHVTSKIDSRTILGEMGAEQLLGKGDMLYMAGGKQPIRIHGPFVSDDEVRMVADHWRAQGQPTYVEAVTEEPSGGSDYLYEGESVTDSAEDRQFAQACQVVIESQRASISSVQRALRIGYNTAARHIDRMADEGIISEPNHLGRREVLVDRNGQPRRGAGD